MNPSHRELARLSFVIIGEYLEGALDITLAGQSVKITSAQVAAYAAQLQQIADKLAVSAAFLHTLANSGNHQSG